MVVIANDTVKKHCSRPMKMRYFYSCEQVRRGNFNVQYHPGLECLGDYPSKHHSTAHHQKVRSIYLHTKESPLFLPRSPKPSDLRGCIGKHWRATNMDAHYQCSPETDHDFLRDSPLMEFQMEVYQASKCRGAKPVILAKHTTLARCTRQDSNLLLVEGCQYNNN